jgi:ketosteroid isomerase-like protein
MSSPFHAIDRDSWHAAVARLHDEIPRLAPHQVVVRLMQLMVMIGDGHTIVVPPYRGPLQFHRYAVDLHDFADGLFVRSAAPRYRALVGQRVIRVGSVAADSLAERIATVMPHDNAQGIRWGLEMALPMAEVLHAVGIAGAIDRVELTLVNTAGDTSVATLRDPAPVSGEMLEMLTFVGERPEWPSMAPGPWRRLEEPYWFEELPADHLVHLHFNQVRSGAVPFPQFVDSLFGVLAARPGSGLVIDLRHNEGGDLTLLTPFITRLIASPTINRPGRLFVVTGKRTFSAAGYLAARLEQYTAAIFVGEPPATGPNFIGESSDPFQLPHSRLWVNASTLAWQGGFAFDRRSAILPDLPAPLTSAQFRAGVDPALVAIRGRLGQPGTAAGPTLTQGRRRSVLEVVPLPHPSDGVVLMPRSLFGSALLLAALSAPSAARAQDAEYITVDVATAEALDRANAAFSAAWLRGDGPALAAAYSADAILHPPAGGVLVGTALVSRYWGPATSGEGRHGHRLEARLRRQLADGTVLEMGRWHSRRADADGRPADWLWGCYTVIWHRGEDGRWRMGYDGWSVPHTEEWACGPRRE